MMFGSVAFVVWRESVEALLVIGILDAWLRRNAQGSRSARRYLWGGVACGLVAAVLLGGTLVALGDLVSEDAQTLYQTIIVLMAAGLIVQMVLWMRQRGRSMKRDLETSLQTAVGRQSWWGVFVLALLAVAREGSETAVFLYGLVSAGGATNALAASAVGLGLAVLTYGLLMAGSRFFSWRVFFRATEIMLMALASALFMSGVDGLIDLGLLPKLSHRLWDTTWLLSDGTATGGFISALTGYRASPNLMELLAFAAFWGTLFVLVKRPQRPVAAPA